MKDNIFREYDIRGKVPTEINNYVAYKIGLGYGSYLQEFLNQKCCVISYDNRLSSKNLHSSLLKGLLETGIDVIDYGLTTTPMHYYARHVNNLFGVMITASHNPSDENGFKFSFDEFANARGQMVKDLKNYIDNGIFLKGKGKVINKDIKEDYIDYVLNNIKLGKRKIKVVLDPGNGTTTCVVKDIFNKLPLDVVYINDKSDGHFPNHCPDPAIEENLSMLKEKVLEVNADLGVAFDGDGDRIGIVDEKGCMVAIEDYGVIIVRNIIDKVKNKKFLYDAKCSDNFKDEVLKLGGTPVICRTGSSYTQEKVLKENIPFGIQCVGHISINDRLFSTESAMYSSLRLIEVLTKTKQSLSTIVDTIPKYFNTPELKYASKDENKFNVIKDIQKYCDDKGYKYIIIDGLKVIFKDSWAYVRASNTGPNITLRCESKDKNDLDNLLKLFETLINAYNK